MLYACKSVILSFILYQNKCEVVNIEKVFTIKYEEVVDTLSEYQMF